MGLVCWRLTALSAQVGQDRQENTFHESANPRDLTTVHSRYTHRSSAQPESPLWSFPSPSLTTKGSRIHLWGRVAKPLPLVSSLTPVHPLEIANSRVLQALPVTSVKAQDEQVAFSINFFHKANRASARQSHRLQHTTVGCA